MSGVAGESPLGTPASHFRVPGPSPGKTHLDAAFHSGSLWKVAGDSSSPCVPGSLEDPDGVLSSRLVLSPALAGAGIWGMNQ